MKNKNLPIDDNWKTPDWLYNELNAEFNFNYDPCPFNDGEILVDGLDPEIPWNTRSFVNPPYSKAKKEAFVKRAIKEQMAGNIVVMLLPVSTSSALWHDFIRPNAQEIRFIRGRVKFEKRDENGNWYAPKSGGMHDSMVCIFKPPMLF